MLPVFSGQPEWSPRALTTHVKSVAKKWQLWFWWCMCLMISPQDVPLCYYRNIPCAVDSIDKWYYDGWCKFHYLSIWSHRLLNLRRRRVDQLCKDKMCHSYFSGFPPALENLENGRAFSRQGKFREFWTYWKKSGNVIQNTGNFRQF